MFVFQPSDFLTRRTPRCAREWHHRAERLRPWPAKATQLHRWLGRIFVFDPHRVAHGSPGSLRPWVHGQNELPTRIGSHSVRPDCATRCGSELAGGANPGSSPMRLDPGLPCTTRKGSNSGTKWRSAKPCTGFSVQRVTLQPFNLDSAAAVQLSSSH